VVWGYDVFPTTRTVDNYILSLRKKIEDIPSEPKHLITAHTSGYKFVLKPKSLSS
jgi:DNA-binding response OmpR family regulator